MHNKLSRLLAGTILGCAGLALAQPLQPAWQLLHANPGDSVRAGFTWPDNADLAGLEAVMIAGTDAGTFEVHENPPRLVLNIGYTDGSPLSFEHVTLRLEDGDVRHQVGPTEVHWITPDPEAALLATATRLGSGTPMQAAFLIENVFPEPVEVTGLHYAPASLSTGSLAVATGFSGLSNLDGVTLPDASESLPASTDEFTGPSHFRQFDFAEGSLTLAPGEQAVLLLDGAALTNPLLFHTGYTQHWQPWLDYVRDGTTYQLTLLPGLPRD